LFFQCYPTFQRFDCKVFPTGALRYVSAAPARVMIDNTHVVVLRGAGRDLIAISSDLSAAQNESNIRIGHGA
jgi:hypothetical protein